MKFLIINIDNKRWIKMRFLKNFILMCDPFNKQGFCYSGSSVFIMVILIYLLIFVILISLPKLMFMIRDPCTENIPICENQQKCANGDLFMCLIMGFLMASFGSVLLAIFCLIIFGIYVITIGFFKDCISTYNKADDMNETADLKKNDEIIDITM